MDSSGEVKKLENIVWTFGAVKPYLVNYYTESADSSSGVSLPVNKSDMTA